MLFVTWSTNRVEQPEVSQILAQGFFDRAAEIVAHDLIGNVLCWQVGDKILSRTITETEAYIGPEDLASHAARGPTKRNAPMFGPAGTF
jgi:DNA-3-methyladenine glycosylase